MGQELRPYQQQARDHIHAEWENGHTRTLLVLPTGTGKTIVFASVAADQVRAGDRVLILAHRGELLEQAADKLQRSTGLVSAVEKADATCLNTWFRVVVGSVQTLQRTARLERFPHDYFGTIMGNSAEGRPSAPYTDPQFARNYAECKRLGIPCGVYGYFKAVNREQADKELAYFKKLLTGRSFELPVVVDIEDEVQKPLGKAALTDLTAYMLSTVESWGVYALLYTGLWFGNTFLYIGGTALKPYDVWLAAYRTRKPTPGWPFGMWQYTSTARMPGVSTNVDLSRAYKDYAAIIRRAGLGAVKEV